jgi:site-specific DNA-cytosine methylase
MPCAGLPPAASLTHSGGLGLDENANDMFSGDLVHAILHLATQIPEAVEPPGRHSRPPSQLQVMELCAGAGGMAIGLMSSGFSHVALYESNRKRVRTLRASWPAWPVVKANIKELTKAALQKYQGIDLLAGGQPNEAFVQDHNVGGPGSPADLFPAMLQAIRIVRPRAFVIEIPPGISLAPHVTYLAAVCAEGSRLGYRTELTNLNLKDYGLPQDRQRAVIVGMRNDEPGTYLPPKLSQNITRSVTDALGPLVIQYETPKHFGKRCDRSDSQQKYDEWAAVWRSLNRTNFLTSIPRNLSENREDRLAGFHAKGFDGSSYSDDAAKVGEMKDSHFRPRITLEVIACAQGMPKGWKYEAIGGGNIDMVADAFPPILAKAVGLSIYSALTGTSFDLDAALAAPLIDENRIGKRRLNINRVWSSNFRINDQVERFLRDTETMPFEPDLKKRTRGLKELVEGLEPTAKRRPALRRAIDRALSHRRREQAEDLGWLNHLAGEPT